eukprot:1161923-Pelagomonas_calceolata.AAC.10
MDSRCLSNHLVASKLSMLFEITGGNPASSSETADPQQSMHKKQEKGTAETAQKSQHAQEVLHAQESEIRLTAKLTVPGYSLM